MSVNPFGSFSDSWYLNLRLGTHMPLPRSRENGLHFLEHLQKKIPQLSRFKHHHDTGNLDLEEPRMQEGYRWLSIEEKRFSSGWVNPTTLADGVNYNSFLLKLLPSYLGVSPIEIDYMDVLIGFDHECMGNHNEIVIESLMPESPLTCFSEENNAQVVNFRPSVTVALSEDCRLQGQIDIIPRTSTDEVRSGEFGDQSISVYLIVRRYRGDGQPISLEEMYNQLVQRAEDLARKYVVPRILRPLSSAIASRS
jgi:hypothetical protein